LQANKLTVPCKKNTWQNCNPMSDLITKKQTPD
jgi:hypothetical protein